MSSKRYTDEFKVEAVRQVTDRGFKVTQVAEGLGVTTHSLYAWLRKFGKPWRGAACSVQSWTRAWRFGA